MKNVYTCIDIGSDTIRILVSELYEGKLHTLAVSSVKSKGIKSGLIADQAVLSERINLALDDIEDRINVRIKKAIINIPSINVEYNLTHGNIPIVNDEKMVTSKDIIRLKNTVGKDIAPNMELVEISPIDFTIYENGSEIETIADPKNRICDRLGMRAMVVTAPKSIVIDYIKAVEACGVEVVDIALSSIADYEEVATQEMRECVSALINIGKDITTVSVFNKGIITNSNVIKMGSRLIDDNISYIYYTSLKKARKIKEVFGVAHPRYANKSEGYDTLDVNGKQITINQYEFSEIINKKLVEILNIAKNELKVLTNKKISYIIVLGGITDIPAINYVLEDVFGNIAKVHDIKILGIRKARFITAIGSLKHFLSKIKLRGKQYSMFSSDEVDELVHNKLRIGRNNSIIGRFVSYFFDN